MKSIIDNKKFLSDYERLNKITLNPMRHTATNAHEHCEWVRERVSELAVLNNCSEEEQLLLENLAIIHDIGKIKGTANPSKSVELLYQYGNFDEDFVNLVKFHDTNLPWYLSMLKDQIPGDKAWKRLARKTDLKLLCIFMVADRVDCPGGWKLNAPLVWFLNECKNRNLINSELVLNDGPDMPHARK